MDKISLAKRFLTNHHEQEIVEIFTHMNLVNLTWIAFKLY